MARRRLKSSGKRKSDNTEFYLIFFGGFLVIVFLIFFFFNHLSSSVKGTSDFRNPSIATNSGKTCMPGRVASFSVESTCDNGDKDGFALARYTCGNGTTGILNRGCMNPAQAFAYAKLSCGKSTCSSSNPSGTLAPKPSSKPLSSTSPRPPKLSSESTTNH